MREHSYPRDWIFPCRVWHGNRLPTRIPDLLNIAPSSPEDWATKKSLKKRGGSWVWVSRSQPGQGPVVGLAFGYPYPADLLDKADWIVFADALLGSGSTEEALRLANKMNRGELPVPSPHWRQATMWVAPGVIEMVSGDARLILLPELVQRGGGRGTPWPIIVGPK